MSIMGGYVVSVQERVGVMFLYHHRVEFLCVNALSCKKGVVGPARRVLSWGMIKQPNATT
jgi:hypothetical protein